MRFALYLLLVFFSSYSIAANKLLPYEPKIVSVTGTIKVITYPGPPNYESIKNGDQPETSGYLILDHPIDVTPSKEDDINEFEKNAHILQLVILRDNDWKKIKNGKHVRVTGTLFHRQTGHHHTRVLVEAREIYVIEPSTAG